MEQRSTLNLVLASCLCLFSFTSVADEQNSAQTPQLTNQAPLTVAQAKALMEGESKPVIQTIHLDALQRYAKLRDNLRRRNISLSSRRYSDNNDDMLSKPFDENLDPQTQTSEVKTAESDSVN